MKNNMVVSAYFSSLSAFSLQLKYEKLIFLIANTNTNESSHLSPIFPSSIFFSYHLLNLKLHKQHTHREYMCFVLVQCKTKTKLSKFLMIAENTSEKDWNRCSWAHIFAHRFVCIAMCYFTKLNFFSRVARALCFAKVIDRHGCHCCWFSLLLVKECFIYSFHVANDLDDIVYIKYRVARQIIYRMRCQVEITTDESLIYLNIV